MARVYSLIQNHVRTQANSSCGLHYHIGIGHLSLESVKKLVTLVMVVEDWGLFQTICAHHRSLPASHYCQPVSRLSRAAMDPGNPPESLVNPNLERHLPHHHGISRDLLLTLSRVWDCGSLDEIEYQTLTSTYANRPDSGYSRRGGFAVGALKCEPDINGALVYSDRTIEFRYKESTGSALEDEHWLRLCIKVVRGAELPCANFRGVMGICSTADTLEDLLRGLGVEEDEVQWWEGIAARNRVHRTPVKRVQFLAPENVSNSGVV